MTNFEKIKSMSPEELAHFLSGTSKMCKFGELACEFCDHYGEVICNEELCVKWLQMSFED